MCAVKIFNISNSKIYLKLLMRGCAEAVTVYTTGCSVCAWRIIIREGALLER